MISGIGFAGAMGVGKDTCSEILKNLLLYETSVELKQPIFVEQLAFADSLKRMGKFFPQYSRTRRKLYRQSAVGRRRSYRLGRALS